MLIVQAPIPALLAYLIRVAFPDLDEDWECQAASCFLGENMSSPCSAALPMMLAPLGGRGTRLSSQGPQESLCSLIRRPEALYGPKP